MIILLYHISIIYLYYSSNTKLCVKFLGLEHVHNYETKTNVLLLLLLLSRFSRVRLCMTP